jgi:hypothetical protein
VIAKCIDPDTGAERCAHVDREPNPHGGAWWCPECGAYPLIGRLSPVEEAAMAVTAPQEQKL